MTGVVLAALRHAELAPEAACNRCYLMRSLHAPMSSMPEVPAMAGWLAGARRSLRRSLRRS